MFGSRARKFSDCVMLTAAMSSLMPLRFWMSLARCGPPAVHPKPPPNKRAATKPKRAKVMQFLRSDGGDICYRKCNDNQRRRDRQHIADDAVFAALARLGRGFDDALVHKGLHRFAQNPLSGNGTAQAFDPLLKAPRGWRVDAHRRRAHIHPVTRTTNHAGGRRISLPSSERARAVLIRHHSAEDLSDVVL